MASLAVNVNSRPPVLRNVVPPGYRLRLPGPAAVPERVRAAVGQPVLNRPAGAGIAAAAAVLAR